MRNHIVALDATTGNATSWNPNPNNFYIYSLGISGSTIYVGGDFTSIGGQARNKIATLDAVSGNASSWNPNADSDVYTLAISGSTIYIGGNFIMIGEQSRNNVAALNLGTGRATAWNPNTNGRVNALAVLGSTVYIGGQFTSMGGQSRNFIASVDATVGNVTNWNPNPNNHVYALATTNSVVYVGGNFSGTIGGKVRNYIAAFDALTGNITSWNPNANTTVLALALSGSSIYAGGSFSSIGGQTRNRIAALDMSTGNASSWNPNANDRVFALAVSGSTVYAGGDFYNIGGQTRRTVAALEASTGNATSWHTFLQTGVRSLAVSGSSVYVGGVFQAYDWDTATRRNYIAAFNALTGNVESWTTELGWTVHTITPSQSNTFIYLGGLFAGMFETSARPYPIGLTPHAGMPSTITKLSSDGQASIVGTQVTNPFTVRVTEASGNSVAGINVAFAIASVPTNASGQSLSNSNAVTNALGEASTVLTLGSKPGTYTVTATSPGLTGSPLTFTVTANPGPPAAIASSFGDKQQGAINKNLDTPLSVIVSDAFGNRVPNASVSFTITSAPTGATGQSLDPPYILTDENGQATTILRLGNKVGTYTVKATAVGVDGNQATFTANAIAGAPTTITTISGAGQSATIGSVLPNPFVVALTDGGGNPIAGVNVAFAITSTPTGATGQMLSTTNVPTTSNGQASALLTLGNKAGAYTVSATSGALTGSPITFSSTALNPLPSLNNISPASAGRGSKINVLLTGANFIEGATTISFGADIAVNSFTIVSSTEIRTNISIASTASSGSKAVTITVAEPGGGTAILPTGFTVDSSLPTNVEYDPSAIPTDYQLFDAYPNPFNPSTTIRFGLPERSTVKLRLYNTLGTLVEELMEGEREAGQYSFRWSPRNAASGVYLIQFEAQSTSSAHHYSSSRKVIFLK